MQFSRTAIFATVALMVFAFFGAQSLAEYFIVADVRSYFIAAIVWLLCLVLVRNRSHQS
jgi:high-affinity Fe2+/Pb2+ permease